MAGEWYVTTLERAPIEIIDGDRGTNYPNQGEFSASGHCLFLNAGNVTTNGFSFSDCAFITAEKDALLRKGKLVRNDVVLTTRGTVGNSAYFDDSVPFDQIRINSGMVILRARQPALHSRYLHFFVRSALFHAQVAALRTGSAQPQLPIRDINRIEIPIPPLPDQRAIAHILGTLDDKIELNRRMNETLEAIARALFHSWFVAFDPVRRNMARKGRGQPSPGPSGYPLPKGEGQYRSGYDFSGLVETARELRKAQTPAEDVFWELVRDRRVLNLKFRRQHEVGDYIADFYCHDHRLVLELDGGIHSAKRKKDHKRDAWMETQGLTVLRFPNEKLFDDPESVLAAIYDAVRPAPTGREAGRMGVSEAIFHPLPLGEGRGEGVIAGEAYDHLFPDSFEDSDLGEIPKGWRIGSVDDEFDLTMGQSPPGETYNEASVGLPFYQGCTDFGFRFPTRRIYCTAPTRLGKAGDTLVSVRAPVGDINMATEDCAIGRGVAAVRHKTGSRSYSYQFMQSIEEVFARFEAEGTVFGSIGKKDFHAIACVNPPRELVLAYEAHVSPLDDRVEVNERESRTLTALRDALLPKLISGELRVKDAEQFIGRTV